MSTEKSKTTEPAMTADPLLCGVILKELKKINEIDYKETSDNDYWDGTLSFSGIKRMIYGLWNDGKNEKGEDMLKHMSPTAEKKYKAMIKKYSKMPKMSVFL